MKNISRNFRSGAWRVARLAVPGFAAAFFLAPQASASVAGGPFGPGGTFFAAQPIAEAELAQLRGGFMINGIRFDISLKFVTALNGGTSSTPDLFDSTEVNFEQLVENHKSGVRRNITVTKNEETGAPVLSVETIPTSALSGVMNNIQNDVNKITLDNVTTLSVQIQHGDFSGLKLNTGGPRFNPRSLIGMW